MRILDIPSVEERISYKIESTVCGSCLSYSVTLRGWLSPLVWSFSRPYADRVARALIEAAEEAAIKAVSRKRKSTLQSELF